MGELSNKRKKKIHNKVNREIVSTGNQVKMCSPKFLVRAFKKEKKNKTN